MSTKQTHRLLDPAAIVPSPTNPRKHFDPAKLAELTESVKMRGVLQPILVRKHHGSENRFEIVCGERRWRAATAAKVAEIPVMICDLDDEAVLEVQVIENLQRDDLHPLEEAEGYDALMKLHGHTAADIAAKVGKDKSYVNKRMKLLALIPKAREAFYANKITPSIALLLARVPDEKAQAEGLKYSQQEDYQDNLPTAADISHFLKEKFMLVLKDAPFDIHDATLTAVGACSACPKRTANQTDLFGEDMKGDDRCLDAGCYKKKVATWEGLQLAEAKQSGQTVLKGAEADAVFNYNSKYLRLDQGCDEDAKRRTWKQVLAPAIKHGQIKTALAQTRDGLIAVVSRSEALKHSGLAVAQKMSKAHDEGKAQAKAARVEAERKDFIRSAKVDAVLGRISAAAENGDMGEFEWRILADCAVGMGGFYVSEDVARRRGMKAKGERPNDTLEREIKKMDHAQLVCLVFEMLALRHDDPLNDMAKRHGLDLKDIERQAREEFAREKDSAGARPEAAQPARVGKQTKAVTQDAKGKDARVAKGRAPVFDGDEVTRGFFTKGGSVDKLAPGVLPKAKKEKQSTGYDPEADGYTFEDIAGVSLKLGLTIEQFRQMASYEQSKELALWRADHPAEKGKGDMGTGLGKKTANPNQEVNDHGVITPTETLNLPLPKKYKAEIRLAGGFSEWRYGFSYDNGSRNGTVGQSSPIKLDSQVYSDRKVALTEAVAHTYQWFADDRMTPQAVLDQIVAWGIRMGVDKAKLKTMGVK